MDIKNPTAGLNVVLTGIPGPGVTLGGAHFGGRGGRVDFDVVARPCGPAVDRHRSGIQPVRVTGHHHHRVGRDKVGIGIDITWCRFGDIGVFGLGFPVVQ